MQSAILFGLSNSLDSISQQATVRCPGAHCEWEPYLSLAICSNCVDITRMLEKTTANVTDQQLQIIGFELVLDPGAGLGVQNGEVTTYSSPNGLYIDDNGDNSVPLVSYGTSNRSKTVAFQDNDLLLYSLTVMKYSKNASSVPGVPLIATECSLAYCVKSYSSLMKNGVLNEVATPLDSILMPDGWEQEDSLGPNPCPGQLDTNVDYSRPDLQLGKQFNITQAAINSIAEGLSTTLTDSAVSGGNLGATGFYIGGSQYSPSSMQSVYDSENLNVTFTGLSISMTNSMRSNDDNGTMVRGTVGVIVYKVRESWIVLPLVSVLAGCILLALTIIFSRLETLPIWKSSALPIIKVGGTTNHSLESQGLVSGMEERAKKTNIRLFKKPSEIFGTSNLAFEHLVANMNEDEGTLTPQLEQYEMRVPRNR